VNLASMAGPKTGEIPKDSLSMATLPMTSIPTVKFAKRDMSGLTFEGPNSSYMSSLAKLFDAAQILGKSSFLFPATKRALTRQTKSHARSRTPVSSTRRRRTLGWSCLRDMPPSFLASTSAGLC
jgi:hypothetical protein